MKPVYVIIATFLGLSTIACTALPNRIASKPQKPKLAIVEQIMSHDAIGSVILGRVRNHGNVSVRFAQINCDFEAVGGLNDTGFTYANPIDLAPGETASFEVRSLKTGAVTYKCVATGNI
jgi:hypothetical protein